MVQEALLQHQPFHLSEMLSDHPLKALYDKVLHSARCLVTK